MAQMVPTEPREDTLDEDEPVSPGAITHNSEEVHLPDDVDGDDELDPFVSGPTYAAAVMPMPPGGAAAGRDEIATDPGDGGAPAAANFPSFDASPEDDSDPFGDLHTGSTIGGRYRLEKILGRGAMGVVFAASHEVIGKRVAVKCLYPQYQSSPTAVERFFREARIAATVEHPNVIQVYDGGDDRGSLFLAMELLDGETLAARLERAGAMEVTEAVDTFLGIMDGVAAVHDKGVVHRDLKPDNIFLVRPRYGRPAEPKVLDFGISKLKEPGQRELTSLGTVMGTPYYMAPEQVASTRDVDARADVYSLGIMLYEALTDTVPYDGDNVADIFRASQLAAAPALDVVRQDVPAALAALVARAMSADLKGRYRTVKEMRDALAETILDAPYGDAAQQDVRMTVRDVMSPLIGFDEKNAPKPRARPNERPPPAGLDGDGMPITASRALPVRRLGADARATVPLDASKVQAYADAHALSRAPATSVPRWAMAVVAAAGIVTFGAVLTAILAILL